MAWVTRFYHDTTGWDEDAHIRARLFDLLNAQRGFSSRLSSLGLEDLTQAPSPDGISREYLSDIAAMIEQWEPRVRVISIEPAPGDAKLRPALRLHLEVRGGARRLHVTFGRDVPPLSAEGGEP